MISIVSFATWVRRHRRCRLPTALLPGKKCSAKRPVDDRDASTSFFDVADHVKSRPSSSGIFIVAK